MNSVVSAHTKKLSLHAEHVALGAKIGAFGVWEVPLYYSTILEEHQAVRQRAGLFDISHMGEFLVEGPHAQAYLEKLVPRGIARLANGRAGYTPLLNDQAGMIDDIIIYKCHDQKFFVIVNADNVDKDFHWFHSHLIPDVTLQNQTDRYGLLALQGPESEKIIRSVTGVGLPAKGYHFVEWESGMIARTGYTGEDGFEIMVETEKLQPLWKKILESGKPFGLSPAGFGARDTLRLEAAMLLYGHDMDEKRTPCEAGIEWTVDFSKPFIGSEALLHQKKNGVQNKLVGFKMIDRGIPRQGYTVMKNGVPVGQVTSGTFSPTLQANIGMAYVNAHQSAIGNFIEIMIRDKAVKAQIVAVPFYKRNK